MKTLALLTFILFLPTLGFAAKSKDPRAHFEATGHHIVREYDRFLRIMYCYSGCHEMRRVKKFAVQRIHQPREDQSDCLTCHEPREFNLNSALNKEEKKSTGWKPKTMADMPKPEATPFLDPERRERAIEKWSKLKNDDSYLCRQCHTYPPVFQDASDLEYLEQNSFYTNNFYRYMDLSKQGAFARKSHARGALDRISCQTCHQDALHNLIRFLSTDIHTHMKEFRQIEDKRLELEKQANPPLKSK